MSFKYNKLKFILLSVILIDLIRVNAQEIPVNADYARLFDSINCRIQVLQEKIPRLKEARDASYYNVQRDLDLSLFVRAYEEYVMEEELDKARALVEARLERTRLRKDQYSEDFYNEYYNKIFKQINQQRMYYQDLLAKEKRIKNAYSQITDPGTPESYQKADRMLRLALKYANENNLNEIASYLASYLLYNEAVIFSMNSVYDLDKMTAGTKKFEEVFIPLTQSDSINYIIEAEQLLVHSENYSKIASTALDSAYFVKQRFVIAAALSEFLSRAGMEKEIDKYTDQAIKARIDTLNPNGVYKWNEYIVVIDEFVPGSSFENVKKGEAIIYADKLLAAYLKKNQLCKSIDELKFGYSFIIPYESNVKNTIFYYDSDTGEWQFMACYTIINNVSFTQNVSKFMPPMFFDDEMETVLNN